MDNPQLLISKTKLIGHTRVCQGAVEMVVGVGFSPSWINVYELEFEIRQCFGGGGKLIKIEKNLHIN